MFSWKILACLILFQLSLFSTELFAQDETYQLGGYIKYLYSNSEIPGIGRVNDHLFHSRINGKYFLSSNITLTGEIRNRIFYGGSVEKIPDYYSSVKSQHDLGNIDILWWKNSSSIGYSEVDRLNLDFNFDKIQITVGRQRIAWGTNLVWNTTDVFNPQSVLDFDYEERPGVDALRLQYYLSEVSKIEVALKPGKTRESSIYTAKLLLNRWNYDFHFIGGVKAYEPFLGFEWAGDIMGAGFRGEYLYSKISDNIYTNQLGLKNKWSTSFALSGDYTFPNTFYIHTELLYNDRGLTDKYYTASLLINYLNLLTAAKWSIYQELSYEIHPLLRGSVFTIYNPADQSYVFVPSLTWSAVENLDFMLISLLFNGDDYTEYGDYGNSIFIRAKFSF